MKTTDQLYEELRAVIDNVPYEEHPKTAYCGFMLMED